VFAQLFGCKIVLGLASALGPIGLAEPGGFPTGGLSGASHGSAEETWLDPSFSYWSSQELKFTL
jgi:hypothetical protein